MKFSILVLSVFFLGVSTAFASVGRPLLPFKDRAMKTKIFDDASALGEDRELAVLAAFNRRFFEPNFDSFAELRDTVVHLEHFTVKKCSDVFGDREFYAEYYTVEGEYSGLLRRGCYENRYVSEVYVEEEWILLYDEIPIQSLFCANIIWEDEKMIPKAFQRKTPNIPPPPRNDDCDCPLRMVELDPDGSLSDFRRSWTICNEAFIKRIFASRP